MGTAAQQTTTSMLEDTMVVGVFLVSLVLGIADFSYLCMSTCIPLYCGNECSCWAVRMVNRMPCCCDQHLCDTCLYCIMAE